MAAGVHHSERESVKSDRSADCQLQLGSITTAWGILLFVVLPDSPVDARFFDHDEKLLATTRVAQNQVG